MVFEAKGLLSAKSYTGLAVEWGPMSETGFWRQVREIWGSGLVRRNFRVGMIFNYEPLQ